MKRITIVALVAVTLFSCNSKSNEKAFEVSGTITTPTQLTTFKVQGAIVVANQGASFDLYAPVYFDNATLMVAFVKSGVELAYETMTSAGIKNESAYYESLHETPLIANTIARKK